MTWIYSGRSWNFIARHRLNSKAFKHNSVRKSLLCLEIRFSSKQEHLLFFERTWVLFPAFTKVSCNSSSRGFEIFGLLRHWHTHHTHSHRHIAIICLFTYYDWGMLSNVLIYWAPGSWWPLYPKDTALIRGVFAMGFGFPRRYALKARYWGSMESHHQDRGHKPWGIHDYSCPVFK